MSTKRRTFGAQFKLETVLEGIRGEKSIAQICRERDITRTMYDKGRDVFLERAAAIFADQRSRREDSQAERVAEVEPLVGKQALAIEILKKCTVGRTVCGGETGHAGELEARMSAPSAG
jgi:transposase-like protein